MAAPVSNAAMVADNIAWRVRSIAPTNAEEARGFRHADPGRVDAHSSAGAVRTFHVRWLGSEAAHEAEDTVSRVAYHTFELAVAYPAEWPLDKRTRVILDDRSDITEALRGQDGWSGYSEDGSANIGLESRELAEDEAEEDEAGQTTYLRQRWRCLIRETE